MTVGAKTGVERTTPLLATRDGDRIILIASSGGNPKHPGWYYNLKAKPQCRLRARSGDREYEAREADGDERERCWRLAVENYAGYEDYQSRVARRIPVMVLEPSR